MGVSLTQALAQSPYDLGTDYENLGRADCVCSSKIYLAYNPETGWYVEELNIIFRIIRAVFSCFFQDTHLNNVMQQLARESSVPEQLSTRMRQLSPAALPLSVPLVSGSNRDSVRTSDSNEPIRQANRTILRSGEFAPLDTYEGSICIIHEQSGLIGTDSEYDFKNHLRDESGNLIDISPGDFYVCVKITPAEGQPDLLHTSEVHFPSKLLEGHVEGEVVVFYWDHQRIALTLKQQDHPRSPSDFETALETLGEQVRKPALIRLAQRVIDASDPTGNRTFVTPSRGLPPPPGYLFKSDIPENYIEYGTRLLTDAARVYKAGALNEESTADRSFVCEEAGHLWPFPSGAKRPIEVSIFELSEEGFGKYVVSASMPGVQSLDDVQITRDGALMIIQAKAYRLPLQYDWEGPSDNNEETNRLLLEKITREIGNRLLVLSLYEKADKPFAEFGIDQEKLENILQYANEMDVMVTNRESIGTLRELFLALHLPPLTVRPSAVIGEELFNKLRNKFPDCLKPIHAEQNLQDLGIDESQLEEIVAFAENEGGITSFRFDPSMTLNQLLMQFGFPTFSVSDGLRARAVDLSEFAVKTFYAELYEPFIKDIDIEQSTISLMNGRLNMVLSPQPSNA